VTPPASATTPIEPNRAELYVIDKPSPKKRKSKAPPSVGEENERPTVNPPFDVEAFARAATASPDAELPTTHPPPMFENESHSQRPTLTNEVELEAARERSAYAPDLAGGRLPSGLLAIANLRAPSAGPPSAASTTPPAGMAKASPSNIEAAVLGAIKGSAPAPEIIERTIEDPIAEMRERASLGDYTGALEMAELILAADPGSLEAAECAENCRSVLENMYAARLGPSDGVPVVVVPQAQMQWLSIDHRAGFVLSLIDGQSTLEMVIDVSGMQKLDALRILHALVQQRIVAFKT
jgi:hypothetical protein